MTSSQVEIVSSSPFGCVLKDRNRQDLCRESNARAAAFQKNLKVLVRDHFQNCITVSAHDDENSNSHSHKQVDASVAKEQGCNGNGHSNRNLRFLSKNIKKSNGKNKRTDDDYGSSIMSSRQSRILDRWAAKQAWEMVSTIEKQSQEAELLASASASASSNPEKESLQNLQNTPAESEASDAFGNPGASSLVQMWEKRLNRSNSFNNCLNPVSTSSRTSSGLRNNDSEAFRESEMGDSVNKRDDTGAKNDDSFADWESRSDKTAQSEPTTRGHSDAVESEVRIADIIKRLTSAPDDNNDHDTCTSHFELPSRERMHSHVTGYADHREQQRENRSFSRIICSPKIRGRQALADLLMQLEHDRHRELESLGERQAVSRFTHRGRIQAMLKLRFLQRGMAIQDQQFSQSAGSRSFNRLSQRSAITHLRKKFSPGAEHGVTAQNDATSSRNPHAEIPNDAVHLEDSYSSTASVLREYDHLQEATTAGTKNTASEEKSVSQKSEDHQNEANPKIDVKQKRIKAETTLDHQREANPKNDVKQKRINMEATSDHQKDASLRSDVTQKGINMETTFLDLQGTAGTATSLNGRGNAEDQEANQEQHIHSKLQQKSQPIASLDGQNANEPADEQEAKGQQQLCLDSQENVETTASLNDWDENELAEQEKETYFQDQFLQNHYDWIREISRPRSYWEDRRQTWYQEMLNSSSEKEEIRQLLERRRVSTFLASDFRETMDQLMTSRVERQTELEAFPGEEEEEMTQDKIGQLLLAHLRRHMPPAVTQEEEQAEEGDQAELVDEQIVLEEEQEREQEEEDEEQEEEEDEDEEEEEEEWSPISPLVHEASDDFDQSASVQMTSPSTIQTWSYRNLEVGDESDPVASTTSPQSLPAQAYYQDSQQSSPTNRISIETELIYDLRGQIEQLHLEMSELRKSIQSCMDMQVKLHQSNQQEVRTGEVGDTTSPQSLPAQAYYQDSQQSSPTNRISIETELIYDLRGQIEQLHLEMSELRKSIQSCMDMQVKLHQSNQQEVRTVKGMGNNSLDGAPKKRSCCICCEMQVDSLLYRCGHMCTCLKCAHELQWSSGQCPICRAPIDDVVRAFMDS